MGKVILIIAVLLAIGTVIYIYKFKGYKGKETLIGPKRDKGSKSGMTADEIDNYEGEKNQ